MPGTPDSVGYHMLQRAIVVCTALLILIQLLFLGFALDKSKDRCRDTQEIRTYIFQATERSLAATPTLDYYKAHPSELATALENLRHQRDLFEERLDCSLI